MPKRKHCKDKDENKTEYTGKKQKLEKITVVKACLPSIIKDVNICEKINQDVEEISMLAHEASIFAHWDIMTKLEDGDDDILTGKNKEKFRPYFYALYEGTRTKKQCKLIPEEYLNMRTIRTLKYDMSYRSNLFNELAQTLETSFNNNIWMHAYNRIKKFIKCQYEIYDKTMLYRVMKYLTCEEFTLNEGDPIPVWRQGHFRNVKFNPLDFLKDFYMIWKFNDDNGFKNFILIPTFRAGRLHINYGKDAFFNLLSSIKILPKGLQRKDLVVSEYLTLPRKNLEFAGSFCTDGVSCSVRFFRKEKVIHHSDLRSETYIGIDPGMRLFLGGVSSTGYTHENIKYTSKQWYHETKRHERKIKLNRFTMGIDKKIESQRPGHQTWREKIAFKLRHLFIKQALYMQRRVARLKFDEYTCKQRAMAKLINEKIVKNHKSVTVFFGDATQSSNSPIKGYIRNPHSLLRRALQNHKSIKVQPIDEYNTTKYCSSCMSDDQHSVSKSPHRFSSCSRCKIVWNRDVNAGNNILLMGYYNFICKFYYSLRCKKIC